MNKLFFYLGVFLMVYGTIDAQICIDGNYCPNPFMDPPGNCTDPIIVDEYGTAEYVFITADPQGSCEVSEVWGLNSQDSIYIALTRGNEGAATFKYYFNTDCDNSNNDVIHNGAEAFVKYIVKNNGELDQVEISAWNTNTAMYEVVSSNINGRAGASDGCSGVNYDFIEVAFPIEDIYDQCQEALSCSSVELCWLGTQQGGGNSAECDTFRLSIVFDANTAPIAIASSGEAICFNNDEVYTFDASGSSDLQNQSLIYEWDFNWDGDPVTFNTDQTGEIVSHQFSSTGPILVGLRVSDELDCPSFDTIDIYIIDENISLDAAVTITDCVTGETSVDLIVAGGSGDFSFDWDNDGTGDFDDPENISGLLPGIYCVTVADNLAPGCDSASICVEVSELLSCTVSVVDSTTCTSFADGSASVIPIGGTPPYTYMWSNGITDSIVTNISAGEWSVIVTDAQNCQTTCTIEMVDPLPLSCAVSSTDPVCGLSNGELIVAALGGSGNYLYSIDGAVFQTSNSFTGLSGDAYTITVRDSNASDPTACFTECTYELEETNNIVCSTEITEATCGFADGSVTITGNGGSGEFEYSLDNIVFQSSNMFSGLTAGIHSAFIRDINAANPANCTSSCTFTITEISDLFCTAEVVNATCGGTDGIMTVFASGGSGSFEYSLDGINYQLSNVFTNLNPGVHTILIRDLTPGGCSSSCESEVFETNDITCNLEMTPATCYGASDGIIEVTGSGGSGAYIYSIDAGLNYQSSNLFSGLTAGSYSILIQDANAVYPDSCTSDCGIINVEEPGCLTLDPILDCSNLQETQVAVFLNISGGTAPYSYNLDGGTFQLVPNDQIIYLEAGVALIIDIIDDSGCNTDCMGSPIILDMVCCSIECPIDDSIYCGDEQAIDNWLNSFVLDGCIDATVLNDYDPLGFSGSCGTTGSQTIKFVAWDNASNLPLDSCTATLTIFDDIVPDVTGCAIGSLDMTIECGVLNETEATDWDAANIAALELCAIDDCGSITVTSDFDFGTLMTTCGNSGTLAVTYTITDECTNSSTFEATLTIEDTMGPDVTGCAIGSLDMTLECGALNETEATDWDAANIAALELCAIDDCGSITVTSDFDFGTLMTTCGNSGTLAVTYTITDECTNSSTFEATTTIEDTMGPDVTGCAIGSLDMTLECGALNETEATDWDAANIAALELCAIDDCGSITVTSDFDFGTLMTTCGNSGTLAVTYTITDECTNSSTFEATLTIEDTMGPDVTGCAIGSLDMTLECGALNETEATDWDAANIAALELCAIDDCGSITVTSDFDFGTLMTTCGNSGTLVVTYTITDECTNSSTFEATLTIEDTMGPDVTGCAIGSLDMTIECGALNETEATDWDAANILALEQCAMDECGGITVTSDYDFSNLSTICGNSGILDVSYTIADDCGTSSIFVSSLTIEDTMAPDLSGCATGSLDITVECGALNETEAIAWDAANILSLEQCAMDDCGGITVTSDYDFSNLSTACGNSGTLDVNYTIADDCGTSSIFVASLTIEDTMAPDLSGCATGSLDLTIECGALNETEALAWDAANILALEQCAMDDCGGIIVTSDYDFSNLSIVCGNSGTLDVNYTIADDCGTSSIFAASLTIEDTMAPDLSGCAIGSLDLTIECGALNETEALAWDAANILSLEQCAMDDCGGITVTSDYDFSNLSTICGNSGTLDVNYTIADDCGTSSIFAASLTIEDTMAPDLSGCATGSLDLTIECGALNETEAIAWNAANILALEQCAMDDCGSITVTSDYDFSNLSIVCGNSGTLDVNYTIADDCGNISIFAASLTIEDTTSPVISIEHSLLEGVESGDTVLFQCYGMVDSNWQIPNFDPTLVIVVDDCDDDVPFTYSTEVVSIGDCVLDGYLREYYYGWIAEDGCGNADTFEILVRLVDTIPPVLIGVPNDTTISCNEIPALPTVIAMDECQCENVQFEQVMDTTASCMDETKIYRTWIGSDCCGNTVTAQQVITLIDDAGPVFVPEHPAIADIQNGDTLYFDCNNGGIDPWLFELKAEDVFVLDQCSDIILFELDYDVENTEKCSFYGYKEKHTLTWRAVDACGNVGIYSFQAHLIDTVFPVIEPFEDTICVNELQNSEIVAYDACGTTLISTWDIINDGDCGTEVIRNFEVSDECGNTTTFKQFIYIKENELPGISFVEPIQNMIDKGDTLTVDCSFNEGSSLTGLGVDHIIFDSECELISSVEFEEKILEEYEGCGNGLKYKVLASWLVYGQCGTQSSISMVVLVSDRSAPYFPDFNGEINVECGDEFPKIIALDNCGNVEVIIQELEIEGECGGESIVERHIIAVDECGNTADTTQIIRVIDTQGPVFKSEKYACYEDNNGLVAYDKCTEEEIQAELIGEDEAMDCNLGGQIVIQHWAARDACGNTSYFDKHLLMDDTISPDVIFADELLKALVDGNVGTVYTSQSELFEAIQNFDQSSAIGYDNCDIVLIPDFSKVITGNDCEKKYLFSWEVTDFCGNKNFLTFEVLIIDDLGPTIINPPRDTIIYCGNLPDVPNVQAEDNFGNVMTELEEIIIGDVNQSYELIRKWKFFDDCGNETVVEQRIEMESPRIDCEIIQDDEIFCASHENRLCLDVSGGTAPYTYEWTIVSGLCIIEGEQDDACIDIYIGFAPVEISVTVTDANGCSSTCIKLIECIDDIGNKTAAIPLDEDEPDFEIYPNPVHNTLTISYSLEEESVVDVRIFNSVGKLMSSEQRSGSKGSNEEQHDVSKLNPGLYYLHLNIDGRTGIKKIIRIN